MTIATVNYANIHWQQDGTPFNDDHGDVYFSRDGGLAESTHVYLNGNRLPQRWSTHFAKHRFFVVCEAGFGTGLNFLNTLDCFNQHALNRQQLWYYAIEKSPLSIADIQRALHAFPELTSITDTLLKHYPARLRGWHHLRFGAVNLVLIFDDIENALNQIRQSNVRVDAWYLDGFSPATNGDMWTESVLFSIGKLSRAGATASTYSVTGHVRRALEHAGFCVRKEPGFGKKREMTCADMMHQNRFRELSDLTRETSIQIVGGGIAGCALAHELAVNGRQVTLYENDSLGGALARHPAAIACPRWTRDHNVDTQWSLFGLLRLHQLVTDDIVLHRELFEQNDFNDDDFRQLGLLDDFVMANERGWKQSLALTLTPSLLCQKLVSHDNITVKYEEFQTHRDGISVYCIGPYALEQFAQFPLSIVRGQMSLTQPLTTHGVLAAVERDEQYRIRLNDDSFLIGASFERDCTYRGICEISHLYNQDKFNQRYPDHPLQREQIVNGIADLRLTSRDHMPIVDQMSDNTFINVAHGSHGLMSAFSAAAKLRTLLLGEPQTMPTSLLRKTSIARLNSR